MRLPFVKCHGSGNDFALVDARELTLSKEAWAEVALALSDRTGPVGSDGLLLLTAGDDDGHHFGQRMFNPDGTEAETCLNGLRCTARAGMDALRLERARVRMPRSQAAVARDVELSPGVATVELDGGPAGLDVREWPMRLGVEDLIEAVVSPLSDELPFTAISMPNPHLIHFPEEMDEGELVRVGRICEAAPPWLPNRANVSFAVVSEGELFVRTHERGAGLTEACGSAMGAALIAAGLSNRIPFGTTVTIRTPGGPARGRAEADLTYRLSGNATFEWEGEAEIVDGRVTARTVTRRFDEEVAAWNLARTATR